MSLRNRVNAWVFWGSVVLALLLTIIKLPDPFNAFKPFWLGILVIYWALEAPERMSLGLAFVIGLTGDVLAASLLGEHALRLVIIAFIVARLRARMRFFPVPQQSLAVLALLVNDRIVMLMLRAFAGEGMPVWTFWIGPLVGMLLWPWLFLALDLVRARSRGREP